MSTRTALTTAVEYDWYTRLREDGLSPLEAIRQIREEKQRGLLNSLVAGVISITIGIVLFGTLLKFLKPSRYEGTRTFSIESPSGKTVRELPLYQALRIIRKRGWDFAEVEPIRPPRFISRREAFNILLFGDNQTK